MRYAIITPVFNEENSIKNLLQSVAGQTLKPVQWVIYDDGSTDQTAAIITAFAADFPWIKLVQNKAKKSHMAGTNIARIFNNCYRNHIIPDIDFVVKLDADLSLKPNYFEAVAAHFAADQKLAVCGGICLVEINGEWIREKITNKDHVRGAIKAYRKTFLDHIGGLREIDGWDAVDEMLAKFYQYTILADQSLEVLHHRPTDRKTGHLKAHKMTGRGCYFMGFNAIAAGISCSKRIKYKPMLIGPCVAYGTYVMMFFGKEKKAVTPEQGRFISKLVIKNAMKKVFG
ncbi:MAG TPA: glycosyltransferase family A protein [Bacteroidales bacterium]|nr:glycosyltransferase family 2 protein [Bacteroidales bacterium]HPB24633.1 glycosyltransferase family A protein [Bacteroidales bacterium]HPI29848.1 glycosyltransferase family A protein [Bacteroidales bacterium]